MAVSGKDRFAVGVRVAATAGNGRCIAGATKCRTRVTDLAAALYENGVIGIEVNQFHGELRPDRAQEFVQLRRLALISPTFYRLSQASWARPRRGRVRP